MDTQHTRSGVLDQVRPLLKAGICLHWLHPRSKMPIGEEWSTAIKADEALLRATYRPGNNVGIRPGEWSNTPHGYLHAIDLDIRRPEKKEEAWGALVSLFPNGRLLPSVISGSGGESRHLYFFTSAPLASRNLARSTGKIEIDGKLKNDWEIDLGGTGKNIVIPPSIHPDTGLPYQWERPLDLDFPALMTIDLGHLEALGARPKSVGLDDDHDLEAAFAQGPKNFTDAEIEAFLDDLPDEWVEDRALWITVGLALHHQYEGSDEGFTIWCDWSERSEKFDEEYAAYRWKTFKTRQSTNPVTILTVRRAALDHRLAEQLAFEYDDDGFDAPSSTTSLASLLNDPAPQPSTALSVLDDSPLPAAAPTACETIISGPSRNEDFHTLLARSEDGDLKSNAFNLSLIFQNDMRTHGITAVNAFTQEIVLRRTPGRIKKKNHAFARDVVNLDGRLWTVNDPLNGDLWSDSHEIAVRIMIEAPTTQGGYGIKVTDRDLRAAIDSAAQHHAFHPVRDRLLGFHWDGVPRVERMFIDYLGCPDTAYHRRASTLTLLGAVARVFEPGHKFDFVPILEGLQGKGKSTFIKILGLHWYNELTGDIKDVKEMVETMQGAWIMELGELSAMHRSEVNDLKAFVSRTHDKTRLAFEKRAKVYPRQCIFIGSTNDDTYLRDQTGNRRFWPIKCNVEGMIDNARLAREVEQIWAEAVAMYRSLRIGTVGDLPLHLADAEAESEASLIQDSRRVETPEDVLAGNIMAWLDTPIGDDSEFDDLDPNQPKILRNATCTAQIWEEFMGGKKGQMSNIDGMRIAAALKMIGWERTEKLRTHEINKKYGPCKIYLRPKD